MRQERKTLVMVSLENRDCDYEIVDDSVEYAAYELYERFHNNYDHHEENGDQIFTFSAIGKVPETEAEKEKLEEASDAGYYAPVEYTLPAYAGERAKGYTIYFKANYDDGEGPEDFADKAIYVVFNGRQEYLIYNNTIPHPESGTVTANVTIDEKDYCLSIPAKFDEDGEPYSTGDLGTVTDGKGNTFNLDEGDPLENKVPGVPNPLWVDIVEEIVPDR